MGILSEPPHDYFLTQQVRCKCLQRRILLSLPRKLPKHKTVANVSSYPKDSEFVAIRQ